MRVLVVEDEQRIASFLEYGFSAEGFSVEVADNGRDGLRRARSGEFDIVVLDLMLPRLAGEEVLRALRADGDPVPVVVLTAKDAVVDRVALLNAGADDYVVKPFSFAELLARVHARLRTTAEPLTNSTINHGELRVDLLKRRCWSRGREVTLTNKEFALLAALARHPGQVLSQVQLLDLAWGYGHETGSNVVEVYVGYLRRKLGHAVIETVRGGGYRLAETP